MAITCRPLHRVAQGVEVEVANGALRQKFVGKLLLNDVGSIVDFDLPRWSICGNGLTKGLPAPINTSFSILLPPLALAPRNLA